MLLGRFWNSLPVWSEFMPVPDEMLQSTQLLPSGEMMTLDILILIPVVAIGAMIEDEAPKIC
jgi:hypothetical protein